MNQANQVQPVNAEAWIPSDTNRILPWVNWFTRLIKHSGCVVGEESDVELALIEAIGNALIHGNQRDPRKRVHVRCLCEPESGVYIVVGDEGPGFDPGEIPETVSPVSENGRGIFLMKFYMDKVSFEKGGTEVHMWKASTSKSRTAREDTNETMHAESASRQSRAAVIVGVDQERGETC